MKKVIRRLIRSWILLLIATHAANAQLNIITTATPPVSPFLNQIFSQAGGGIRTTLLYPMFDSSLMNPTVRVSGRIQRLSPSPFTIELRNDTSLGAFISLFLGARPLSNFEMQQAFGNFIESNLNFNGISPNDLKVGGNFKLPDGNYRICFYVQARKYKKGPTSDPQYSYCCTTMNCFCPTVWTIGGPLIDVANPGCGTFIICNKAGGAPQFTQPVTNANINSQIAVVQPVSPVIFSWTPPQSTCGLPPSGYTYDLDIWELFPNQNVTDAVNNPFVFRKRSLPSTTFLLDLNLNKDVLKQGKKYAIRVRAVSSNPASPIEIDNDGYSRIEAFQYGGNVVPPDVDPTDYFIQFKERKTGSWIDHYITHRRSGRNDTLVPVKEYIAFALTQNGIAYSLDAIDLFLALNPDLVKLDRVKLSHIPQLPVFPSLSANDQRNFDKDHATNLEPDKLEENKFLRYLDTLNNSREKLSSNAAKLINDLASHLNNIKTDVAAVDRVTLSYINTVLAELVYQLRLYSNRSNTNSYNQLQKLVTTIRELTTESLNSTSFLHLPPGKIVSSYSSQLSGPYELSFSISETDSSEIGNEIDITETLPATLVKQLLPFDVIVWRAGTVAPYKPVLDAADLKGTFRIFYTLSTLYNHKNPEVNAKSSTRLASTIRVSLPSNSLFSFWTLNMVNHKTTTAAEVDLRDVLKNSMKNEPRLKKPSIVIKVE